MKASTRTDTLSLILASALIVSLASPSHCRNKFKFFGAIDKRLAARGLGQSDETTLEGISKLAQNIWFNIGNYQLRDPVLEIILLARREAGTCEPRAINAALRLNKWLGDPLAKNMIEADLNPSSRSARLSLRLVRSLLADCKSSTLEALETSYKLAGSAYRLLLWGLSEIHHNAVEDSEEPDDREDEEQTPGELVESLSLADKPAVVGLIYQRLTKLAEDNEGIPPFPGDQTSRAILWIRYNIILPCEAMAEAFAVSYLPRAQLLVNQLSVQNNDGSNFSLQIAATCHAIKQLGATQFVEMAQAQNASPGLADSSASGTQQHDTSASSKLNPLSIIVSADQESPKGSLISGFMGA